MNDLKSTAALVKSILEQDSRCRNSDSLLYFRVLSVVAEQSGVDLNSVSIPLFLLEYHGKAFPIFETVRRARQKVQQHYPELAACEAVQEARAENEMKFRTFAAGEWGMCDGTKNDIR